MASVSQWSPFGVSLDLTATVNTVTRTSSTQYTVKFNVSWTSHWGARTDYGMEVTSGGGKVSLNSSGTKATSGSGTVTGTFTTTANVAATKTVTVTFRNYNVDHNDSASKSLSLSVSVPAWTSYKVSYNANGGSGAPSAQTKWKGQNLTLSSTKPTRTGYTFAGWATSASGSVAYSAGATYSSDAAVTLYAKWTAITYTVSYNANGGSGAPGNQTKTYGTALTLSSTKPTRTNYNFVGWGTSAGATTASYQPGGSYTANAGITLYAIWSLAYTKPRISSFSVARCNSSGTVSDSGTYALVRFNFATDKTVTGIAIYWKAATSSSYSNSLAVPFAGSTTVSQVVGGGGLSTETTYNIQVVVTDSGGSSDVTGTIQSIKYPIDIKSGGTGIAFGKTAETSGYMDVAYKAKFNDDVTGPVLGLTSGTSLMSNGDDINNYLTPGVYCSASGNNIFSNHPTDGGAGKLYVLTGLGTTMSNAIQKGTWLNLLQFWVGYTGEHIYHRWIYTKDAANVWTYGSWIRVLSSSNYSSYALPKSGGTTTGGITIPNNVSFSSLNKSGSTRSLATINASNQALFGYGGYSNNEGESYFDGNTVSIRSKGGIYMTSPTAELSSRAYGINKVLWTGAWAMNSDHTVTLSEGIKAQPNGIVLAWSQYSNGAAVDANFVYHFIPKRHVISFPGSGTDLHLLNSTFGQIADKYVYINDTTITGHANNVKTGTGTSGITYNNTYWVLRQVIGV